MNHPAAPAIEHLEQRPLLHTEGRGRHSISANQPVHPFMVVALVMLGNFMGPLYSSTANVIIPNLVASFGSDVETMEWAVTGYMLGYSISMPVAGWLGDTFGRRRVYLVGLFVFVTSSVLASVAWDATSLIGFRILQAVGAGLVSPTGMAIIMHVIKPAQRGRALGFWAMGMMMAPAFGPWISGFIVDTFDDWRLVFWLGVPIGIAGLVMSYLYMPADETTARPRAPFDYLGFSLLTLSLASFLIPLSEGNRVGWDDPWIGAAFLVAACSFAAFITRELRTSTPMLDLSLFGERTFAAAAVLRLLVGLGYYFPLFLLPLFTQDVLGWPPTQSGLVLLPAGIVTAILMPISGILMDRIGARRLILAGTIIAALGTFLFARIDSSWDANRIMLYNAIRTGSLGFFFTPLTTVALQRVPAARTGAASGILNTIWQVGGSLGIAIGQTYLTTQIAVRRSDLVAAASLARPSVRIALQQLRHAALMHNLPESTALTTLSYLYNQAATIQAYGDTFLLGSFVVAIAIPVGLFLKGEAVPGHTTEGKPCRQV
jgi:EmrB/QacA subfamily drug resistance transporter